jgi:uncharacterized protein YqfB (UPF0267 family)
MKLNKVLDRLNSFEKNSFLKTLDSLISESPKNQKEIDTIISGSDKELKNIDNLNIAKVFNLLTDEFRSYVTEEFKKTNSQLDVLIDIIIRDGNCIMKNDWFSRLYETELKALKKKVKELQKSIEEGSSDVDEERLRDYKIYKACLSTAYSNDLDQNFDNRVTSDELSILLTLSKELGLSQEEVKLINYIIIPIQKHDVDAIINDLKNIGVIFYSKKTNTVYVADEVIRCLRKVRNKDIGDKYFRRVLKCIREPQINIACRKHNIDWKQPLEAKIKSIINEGISFKSFLSEDIFKPEVTLTERKNFEKELKAGRSLKGSTLEEKIDNLIEYFEEIDQDDKVGISIEGFDHLLNDLKATLPKVNEQLKVEFELQENDVMESSYLLDYNIKPRDVLEVITTKDLEIFCKKQEISTRGNEVFNILNAYKDSENLFLENYENFAYRDLNALKENNIKIKEAEVGVQFEELTKRIFNELKFNVDEGLRKKLNTSKDKIDIVINIGSNQLILVECKTSKEKGFNKFSSVSRQLKSYVKLAEKNDYTVIKSLLISPEFSDDFVSECNLEYELNLSLIKAKSLYEILDAFKNSKKHKEFPHNLLMKDVVIQEDRILKALQK